ncbi:MAG TPA: hypothetical protein VMU33_20245 [Burkholderiaceae bacterium]|nr:hypothetical protein [Burkholderiaceae bacterium]
MSKEELACRGEIARSFMSSVERGVQNPGIMSLLRIRYARSSPRPN